MKNNHPSIYTRKHNFRKLYYKKQIEFGFLVLTLILAFGFFYQGTEIKAQENLDKSPKTQIDANDLFEKFGLRNRIENSLDPCEPKVINFGQTISGSLTNDDCSDPDSGRVADVYIFNGTQGQAISSAMSSNQFDTFLFLFDLAGNNVAFNDDIDVSTTNSRIPPTGAFTLPYTGQYILFATSYEDNGRGAYTLNLLSGGSVCDFTLNPASQQFTANGGSGSFSVTATSANCDWQATSNNSWITANGGGTGNGTVNFSVAANTASQGRAGTITVGNRTFSVTQNGLSCSYSISPLQPEYPAFGGQFSITINASSSLCPTDVTTNDNWITILNPNGTGTRVLNYVLATNNIPNARNGTFFIGGSQFGILQWWRRTPYSFDTGAQANLSVYRPSSGMWIYQYNSEAGEPINILGRFSFGLPTDKIAPADYDGDGRTDYAVFREGMWYVFGTRNFTFRALQFGVAGDKPIPGDFDGDQKADISVFRPSTGDWYRYNSTDNQFVATHFGASGDVPLMTDFNADGKNEVAVYRPSNGVWYWLDSATGNFNAVNFGIATDIPVAADYDGDSKTDIAVYRPSEGNWYFLNSSNGKFNAVKFGTNGDIPVPAEYDRDGKTDIAVYRPSSGVWYRMKSSSNTVDAWQFGTAEDKPIPSAYQP